MDSYQRRREYGEAEVAEPFSSSHTPSRTRWLRAVPLALLGMGVVMYAARGADTADTAATGAADNQVLARNQDHEEIPIAEAHKLHAEAFELNKKAGKTTWTGWHHEEIPREWDWRNVNGTNFLTPTLNQHIPQYCGSCWAHSVVSAVGDRIKIMRRAQWPDVELSVQYLLNCGPHTRGTCEGGSAKNAYSVAMIDGIPEKTCLQYVARDDYCTTFNTCRNCHGPPGTGRCFAIDTYRRYFVESYENHEDPTVEQMMAQVAHFGPISVPVAADFLLEYNEGVVTQETPRETNHEVSIVGYGTTTTGIQYWIVRNSWGTYWGEDGFFRIIRGKNALGIESEATWAVPKVTWKDIWGRDDMYGALHDKDVQKGYFTPTTKPGVNGKKGVDTPHLIRSDDSI